MFQGAQAIVQAAWFVADIDAALAIWLERGAGPFRVARRLLIDTDYRGASSRLDLSVAWGQLDGMQVECVQQHNNAPSAFRDSYPDGPPAGLGGIHHFGMINADYDRALVGCLTQGFGPATSGEFNGTRFAHIDTRAAYGFMTELTEGTPDIFSFYRDIAESARDWDGSEPIRPL